MEEDNKQVTLRVETSSVLKRTLDALAEGLTGVAAAEKRQLVLSVGHLFQSMRKGQFLSRLIREWDSYRDQGRIKDGIESTEQHHECLQEMLDFLDDDVPDETRFNAMKAVFFRMAIDPKCPADGVIPRQYMKVCRSLSSGELLVLSATYAISQTKFPPISAAEQWLKVIAEKSGLEHPGLVEFNEQFLMQKRLLTPRMHGDGSGVRSEPHFRLTSLGRGLCEFIAHSPAMTA